MPERDMLIYICSPYAGDVERNTQKAINYCRKAIEEGYTPLASHLIYPRILAEEIPEERETGIRLGLELLKVCDKLWVCGDTISKGMEREIDRAEELGIQIIRQEEAGLTFGEESQIQQSGM